MRSLSLLVIKGLRQAKNGQCHFEHLKAKFLFRNGYVRCKKNEKIGKSKTLHGDVYVKIHFLLSVCMCCYL